MSLPDSDAPPEVFAQAVVSARKEGRGGVPEFPAPDPEQRRDYGRYHVREAGGGTHHWAWPGGLRSVGRSAAEDGKSRVAEAYNQAPRADVRRLRQTYNGIDPFTALGPENHRPPRSERRRRVVTKDRSTAAPTIRSKFVVAVPIPKDEIGSSKDIGGGMKLVDVRELDLDDYVKFLLDADSTELARVGGLDTHWTKSVLKQLAEETLGGLIVDRVSGEVRYQKLADKRHVEGKHEAEASELQDVVDATRTRTALGIVRGMKAWRRFWENVSASSREQADVELAKNRRGLRPPVIKIASLERQKQREREGDASPLVPGRLVKCDDPRCRALNEIGRAQDRGDWELGGLSSGVGGTMSFPPVVGGEAGRGVMTADDASVISNLSADTDGGSSGAVVTGGDLTLEISSTVSSAVTSPRVASSMRPETSRAALFDAPKRGYLHDSQCRYYDPDDESEEEVEDTWLGRQPPPPAQDYEAQLAKWADGSLSRDTTLDRCKSLAEYRKMEKLLRTKYWQKRSSAVLSGGGLDESRRMLLHHKGFVKIKLISVRNAQLMLQELQRRRPLMSTGRCPSKNVRYGLRFVVQMRSRYQQTPTAHYFSPIVQLPVNSVRKGKGLLKGSGSMSNLMNRARGKSLRSVPRPITASPLPGAPFKMCMLLDLLPFLSQVFRHKLPAWHALHAYGSFYYDMFLRAWKQGMLRSLQLSPELRSAIVDGVLPESKSSTSSQQKGGSSNGVSTRSANYLYNRFSLNPAESVHLSPLLLRGRLQKWVLEQFTWLMVVGAASAEARKKKQNALSSSRTEAQRLAEAKQNVWKQLNSQADAAAQAAVVDTSVQMRLALAPAYVPELVGRETSDASDSNEGSSSSSDPSAAGFGRRKAQPLPAQDSLCCYFPVWNSMRQRVNGDEEIDNALLAFEDWVGWRELRDPATAPQVDQAETERDRKRLTAAARAAEKQAARKRGYVSPTQRHTPAAEPTVQLPKERFATGNLVFRVPVRDTTFDLCRLVCQVVAVCDGDDWNRVRSSAGSKSTRGRSSRSPSRFGSRRGSFAQTWSSRSATPDSSEVERRDSERETLVSPTAARSSSGALSPKSLLLSANRRDGARFQNRNDSVTRPLRSFMGHQLPEMLGEGRADEEALEGWQTGDHKANLLSSRGHLRASSSGGRRWDLQGPEGSKHRSHNDRGGFDDAFISSELRRGRAVMRDRVGHMTLNRITGKQTSLHRVSPRPLAPQKHGRTRSDVFLTQPMLRHPTTLQRAPDWVDKLERWWLYSRSPPPSQALRYLKEWKSAQGRVGSLATTAGEPLGPYIRENSSPRSSGRRPRTHHSRLSRASRTSRLSSEGGPGVLSARPASSAHSDNLRSPMGSPLLPLRTPSGSGGRRQLSLSARVAASDYAPSPSPPVREHAPSVVVSSFSPPRRSAATGAGFRWEAEDGSSVPADSDTVFVDDGKVRMRAPPPPPPSPPVSAVAEDKRASNTPSPKPQDEASAQRPVKDKHPPAGSIRENMRTGRSGDPWFLFQDTSMTLGEMCAGGFVWGSIDIPVNALLRYPQGSVPFMDWTMASPSAPEADYLFELLRRYCEFERIRWRVEAVLRTGKDPAFDKKKKKKKHSGKRKTKKRSKGTASRPVSSRPVSSRQASPMSESSRVSGSPGHHSRSVTPHDGDIRFRAYSPSSPDLSSRSGSRLSSRSNSRLSSRSGSRRGRSPSPRKNASRIRRITFRSARRHESDAALIEEQLRTLLRHPTASLPPFEVLVRLLVEAETASAPDDSVSEGSVLSKPGRSTEDLAKSGRPDGMIRRFFAAPGEHINHTLNSFADFVRETGRAGEEELRESLTAKESDKGSSKKRRRKPAKARGGRFRSRLEQKRAEAQAAKKTEHGLLGVSTVDSVFREALWVWEPAGGADMFNVPPAPGTDGLRSGNDDKDEESSALDVIMSRYEVVSKRCVANPMPSGSLAAKTLSLVNIRFSVQFIPDL